MCDGYIMIILNKIKKAFCFGIFYIYSSYLSFRQLPGMTTKERKNIKKLLNTYKNKKVRILEWGSGYSTIYYSKYLNSLKIDFEWYGIENSRKWYDKVLGQLKKHKLTDKVHLYLFEFTPFWQKPNWDWDDPIHVGFDPHEDNEKKYISFPNTLGIKFDIIIVDARFRRRCLIEAQEMLAPKGFVILHDAQKTQYQSPLSLYKFGKCTDSGYLYYSGARTHTKMWIGSNDNSNLPD